MHIYVLLIIILSYTYYIHIIYIFNVRKTADDIKDILSKFIEVSSHIKDPRPVRALASCIARLSHEQLHLRVLKEQELLNPILKLLMDLVKTQKGDIAVQESVCVAICHIALSIKKLPGATTLFINFILCNCTY